MAQAVRAGPEHEVVKAVNQVVPEAVEARAVRADKVAEDKAEVAGQADRVDNQGKAADQPWEEVRTGLQVPNDSSNTRWNSTRTKTESSARTS